MSEELAYYIPSAPMVEKIEAVMVERKAINEKRFAFAKRFGTETILATDDKERMVGLMFDDPAKAPVGWTKSKRDRNSYYPSKKTKTLKVLQQEMLSFRFPDFGVGSEHFTGSHLYYACVYKLGEQWIIRQHAKATPPEGATRLKTSEYYVMVEAVEQLAAAAK